MILYADANPEVLLSSLGLPIVRHKLSSNLDLFTCGQTLIIINKLINNLNQILRNYIIIT